MKKFLLSTVVMFIAVLLIAQKPKYEYLTWSWDPQDQEDFVALYDSGWFGDNTFYQMAVTDLTLMPLSITEYVTDFPESVTQVEVPTFFMDEVWDFNNAKLYGMIRWVDRELIKQLFEEFQLRIKTDSETVGDLMHPLFLQDGKIREEISFAYGIPFRVEIQNIKVINQFAVVEAVNLFGYPKPGTTDIQWMSNDDLATVAKDGIYFLIYDCPSTEPVEQFPNDVTLYADAVTESYGPPATESCAWWFFGNQMEKEEKEKEDDPKYPQHHGHVPESEWYTYYIGSGKPDKPTKPPLPGVTNIGDGNIHSILMSDAPDQIYEGDLNEYKFCHYGTGKFASWSICLYFTDIVRKNNSFSCVIAVGLEKDEGPDHAALLLQSPADFELHKQDNGKWVSLPPQAPTWMRRAKNLVLGEPKPKPKFFLNGKYMGTPDFKKAK